MQALLIIAFAMVMMILNYILSFDLVQVVFRCDMLVLLAPLTLQMLIAKEVSQLNFKHSFVNFEYSDSILEIACCGSDNLFAITFT